MLKEAIIYLWVAKIRASFKTATLEEVILILTSISKIINPFEDTFENGVDFKWITTLDLFVLLSETD